MTINDHLLVFEGFRVVDYTRGTAVIARQRHAFRFSIDWEAHENNETFVALFADFLDDPQSASVEALLVGDWGEAGAGNDSAPVIEALVNARQQLPNLRALFLGEMIVDESEISWIYQSDVSPLLDAFPSLEVLYVRGGNGLRLSKPRHEKLRKLVIETGGMPAEVVRDVAAAKMGSLEHLELWLGDEGYGNDVQVEDIRQLLAEGPCRQLAYLGFRNDCRADETAKLLGEIGISPALKVLDLSLGTLGDEGAQALVNSAWLRQLQKLDIHHHYVSADIVARLRSLVRELDASDIQEPDDWDGEEHRYVAVSE